MFQIENPLEKNISKSFIQKDATEQECEVYDKCEKIIIKIIFTKDYKTISQKNGIILRVQSLLIREKGNKLQILIKSQKY
ncbi:unnamed protein product [Paramecium sonneborni]|uniref:Uncharacterized protein n=1 Tax=Paramecium sonneborni TaxID=65129 RepID=A0A8S1LK04_9CILI|nr:unnamed protein product [Paramecium sonneborni]